MILSLTAAFFSISYSDVISPITITLREFTMRSFLQIPSTYAPEMLDPLRQLEKVKQMTAGDISSDEEEDEDI